MYIVITIIIIIICLLLGMIVLIQNPKGGGVNATFGGASQQIFGASRTTDVIEKTTWILAASLLVLSLCSAFFIDRKGIAKANAARQSTTNVAAPVEVTEVEKRLKETGGMNTAMPNAPQGGQQQGQQQQGQQRQQQQRQSGPPNPNK